MSWRAYGMKMAEYNRWMNQRIYEVCRGIPDETRKKDLGAFFGSVHHTLDHLVWADEALMVRLGERTKKIARYQPPMIDDFTALEAKRTELDDALCTWSKTLDDAELDTPYEFVSVTYGRSRTLPRHVLLMHLFNHQTHHRGQVTTLLSQLGYDPGITDLPWSPG